MKTFSWSRLAASRAKNEKKNFGEEEGALSCWGKKQQSTSNLHPEL
jgi:hypothetical protein